jgi:hypothetical protein
MKIACSPSLEKAESCSTPHRVLSRFHATTHAIGRSLTSARQRRRSPLIERSTSGNIHRLVRGRRGHRLRAVSLNIIVARRTAEGASTSRCSMLVVVNRCSQFRQHVHAAAASAHGQRRARSRLDFAGNASARR